MWAKHNIGNFILVGRHFADPTQLPAGIPVQPNYGYDGQFFYRLALNPANLAQTAYGIRVDHSYRFMRIGYPAITWLLSAGQHAIVPDVLNCSPSARWPTSAACSPCGAAGTRPGGAAGGLLLRPDHQRRQGHRRPARRRVPAGRPGGAASAPPLLVGLALAYGALTRETVMVAVGAIAIVRIIGLIRARRAPGRDE
jgi:hypothetical protein